VRFSMSAPAEQIREAMKRIAAFLDENRPMRQDPTTDALRQNR